MHPWHSFIIAGLRPLSHGDTLSRAVCTDPQEPVKQKQYANDHCTAFTWFQRRGGALGDTEFESKTAVEQNPIKHVFYELLAISRYAVSACKDM